MLCCVETTGLFHCCPSLVTFLKNLNGRMYNYSSEHALTENVKNSLDSGYARYVVCGVFVDLEKAFKSNTIFYVKDCHIMESKAKLKS